MIKLIAAVSSNNIIGVNGELPWLIPADLQNFKEKTLNQTIVMGWKTWESLGSKPLPNRVNVILSRTKKPIPRSKVVRLYSSVGEVIKKHKNFWVIGGESVYGYFIPYTDEMYITRVITDVKTKPNDNVSHFPRFNIWEWEHIPAVDFYEDNNFNFYYDVYKRVE